MPKTVAEFKAAFSKVKKPDRPKDVAGAEKNALEKAVKAGDETEFTRLAAALYAKKAAYFVDLLAFKLSKHADDDKRKFWTRFVPPDALRAASKKLVPGAAVDPKTAAALDKAIELDDKDRVRLLYERDPDGTVDAVLQKIAVTHGAEQKKWAFALGVEKGAVVRILNRVVSTRAVGAVDALVDGLAFLQPAELVTLASQDPEFMFAEVLPAMKHHKQLVGWLKDPAVRDQLAALDPVAWQDLVDSTPMLAVTDRVKKKITTDGTTGDRTAITGAIFDAVTTNNGIPLTYYSNRNDSDTPILTGGSGRDRENRELRKPVSAEAGIPLPDIPATQCHELLGVLRQLIEAYGGGYKPTITSDHVKYMLLTKPLASLGTQGLLPSSFQGNVANDAGQFLNQVLFTGNDEGQQSHTWLVIDGVPFDPVLGTRGDQVKAAQANEFRWVTPGVLARGSGGWFIVKDKNLKPPPNVHGFGSAYRLTKNPALYGLAAP